MPTINSTHTIDVSPEKYINACSDNEVRELAILLNSKRFDRIFSENSENSENSDDFRKIPTISGQQLIESCSAGAEHKNQYDRCVKLFGENPVDALTIIGELADKLAIPISAIIDMMLDFKKLEALRIKHLVAKPQEKNEESI